VQFLIHGEGLDVTNIRSAIDRMGQSALVVGNEQRVKVHVHTHDPGALLSYGVRQGVISDVVVENMQAQAVQFAQSEWVNLLQLNGETKTAKKTATVAAVAGPGFAWILQDLGVTHLLEKSAAGPEWLQVIDQVEAEEILILPNSPQAMEVVQNITSPPDKKVAIVPTQTLPAGIAALLRFNEQADFLINVQQMTHAAALVQTIEMVEAIAAGLSNQLTFKKGDILGFINHHLSQVGSAYPQVLLNILEQQEVSDYELITLYFGEGISAVQAEKLADEISSAYPELDLEIYEGGQPDSDYIISLE
jgi:dihydroxyacetone kinase-like predicted kinase